MNVKDLNTIYRNMFDMGMNYHEINEAVRASGKAYLYELWDFARTKHAVIVLTSRTQLNDNTITLHGFDPNYTTTRCIIVFDEKTRTGKF